MSFEPGSDLRFYIGLVVMALMLIIAWYRIGGKP